MCFWAGQAANVFGMLSVFWLPFWVFWASMAVMALLRATWGFLTNRVDAKNRAIIERMRSELVAMGIDPDA